MGGCSGSSSEFIPVEGAVRYDGSPVTRGSIAFYPAEGGRPARGKIGADGRYQLTTMKKGDGARPGDYRVEIRSVDMEVRDDGLRGRTTWLVPERYSNPETSGLEVTVAGEPIDFDLPAE